MLEIGSNSSNYAKHNVTCQYSTARAGRRLAHRSNSSVLQANQKNFTVASTCERTDKFSFYFYCLLLYCSRGFLFPFPRLPQGRVFPINGCLTLFYLTLLLCHHHFEDLIPVLSCQRTSLFCPALRNDIQCLPITDCQYMNYFRGAGPRWVSSRSTFLSSISCVGFFFVLNGSMHNRWSICQVVCGCLV